MITAAHLQRGMKRYAAGERPWPEMASAVDWFIVSPAGQLYPLKYTYGLATDTKPSLSTTNQMKRLLLPQGVTVVSLKSNGRSEVEFERAVEASLKDKAGRALRLAAAPKLPKQRMNVQQVFIRNADVVAAVLERAGGKCEACGNPAPFLTRSRRRPYL